MSPPEPLRVVILGHTAETGGAELSLARLLPVVDPTAYDVTVLLFADGPMVERLRAVGVRVVVEPLDPRVATLRRAALLTPRGAVRTVTGTLGHARRVAARLRELRADVTMANTLKAFVVGTVSARLARVPLVWFVHDRLSADYLPAPVGRALRLLARRGPRHVLVNSRATLATLGPPYPPRTSVAYPGLPAAAFRDALPAPHERAVPVVGLLGRVSPTKGQEEFVRAAALVARDRPVVFRILGRAVFGEAAYAERVAALVDELGLADVVEWAGWVDDPAAALADLDLLVHASPVPEPFGQVVVEAMAVGVPVIASAAAGPLEILDPDDERRRDAAVARTAYGQLVRPGDPVALAEAVTWVLEHPAQARAAADRGLVSARERFGVERAALVVTQAWDRAAAR